MTENKEKGIEQIMGVWDSIKDDLENIKSSYQQLPLNLLKYFLDNNLTDSQKRILKEIFFKESKFIRTNQYFPGLSYGGLKHTIMFCGVKEYLNNFDKDFEYLRKKGLITIAHKIGPDDVKYYNINKQIRDRKGLMEKFRKYIFDCPC